jgi:hypothetical protein
VHEASREAKNVACRVLVVKCEGKRLPERPGVNLRIILKLNFKIGWERGVDRTNLAQDRGKWLAFVNTGSVQ